MKYSVVFFGLTKFYTKECIYTHNFSSSHWPGRGEEEGGGGGNQLIMSNTYSTVLLFGTVPGSSINSWDSWFIFNLRKINTCYYLDNGHWS
jgi:hypothetical protein